jgi:hypothetical protein
MARRRLPAGAESRRGRQACSACCGLLARKGERYRETCGSTAMPDDDVRVPPLSGQRQRAAWS